MRREKRVWIYAGLGVPPGAALVRTHESLPGLADGRRVLVVGCEAAHGLVPPMARLAADSGFSLKVDHRRSTTRDWAQRPWLDHHLASYQPTVVFVVADPADEMSAHLIRRKVSFHRKPIFWMTPPGAAKSPDPTASQVVIPARDLTASGYAAWAGRAWSMVK